MAEALEHTLRDMRLALMRGDLGALPALSERLDAGLSGAQGLSADALHRLRAEAGQTAACLRAAQAGIASARRRFEDIRAGAAGLHTYDRDGRKAAPARVSRNEKRL